ncbi:Retrovirus-related Pol polyprotein [Thelohanellus kitauei]|uniref:Retrovirus-related Pol polyprotein n=1 Tax=Thelohanellus kitauei TaxID=669202 RepID=A0A0C2JQ67_THEKT|nr:Retrovirus-related Pol polyprotein [Thelohanellus kitauei]
MPRLGPILSKYHSVTGSEIRTLGCLKIPAIKKLEADDILTNVEFIVAQHDKINIIGLRTIQDLHVSIDKLLSCSSTKEINSILLKSLESKCLELCKEFPDLWKPELGCVKDLELDIKFKPHFTPIFCKPRPIIHAIKDDINTAIDEGFSKGVWIPTQFNDWATPIVPVRKSTNKKIWICGDYSVTVNKFLEDHRYPIPLPDEILKKLGGCHYFTKIDLSNAYNQIRLTPESQRRLAISTHRGVYLQPRLPFGIKSAPGYFQEIMSKITSGFKGVAVYLDDILITGVNDESHLSNLRRLLFRLQDTGLRCNLNKCEFAKPEVVYLGHTISLKGISKGPHTEAVLKMPIPKDIQSLKSFLGSVQFITSS